MKDLIVFWKSNSGTDPVGALSGCITPSPMTGRRSAVMTGTTLSVGSSVDSWATGDQDVTVYFRCIVYSLNVLICLSIFLKRIYDCQPQETIFYLSYGKLCFYCVWDKAIFSLGIYCVKVLVFGWKIMLRNIVFFCVFQRCKKHKFYFNE